MDIAELIDRIEILRKQVNQLKLSTRDLLGLVPHFRLDWAAPEDSETIQEYNIGVTKPILLSRLAGPEHKLRTESLLLNDNKIALILVDTFLIKKKLSKDLLLEIHSDIIPYGGSWRKQDVMVNDQTYALDTFFSNPVQIERQVTELIEWYNEEVRSRELHPLVLATIFHYNFVKIHPFLDGNGRLARIISSLILLADGIPPPIVNGTDRQDYIYCLRRADLDDLSPLTLFIGNKVLSSMEYMLSAKRSQHE